MRSILLKLYVKAEVLRSTLQDESGQDLIEYALVCSLIAFAAIAGMRSIATSINNAFVNIGTNLASNT